MGNGGCRTIVTTIVTRQIAGFDPPNARNDASKPGADTYNFDSAVVVYRKIGLG